MILDVEDAKDVKKLLNVTEGSPLTIYHECLKDVTFCAVEPPFSPGYLRSGFGKGRADWNINITKISR